MASRKGKPHTEPHVTPSRAHPRGAFMVQAATSRATRLVTTVRDEGAEAVAEVLDPLTWEQMAAVVVVLAAMVPDDQSVADLTAWVHEPRLSAAV